MTLKGIALAAAFAAVAAPATTAAAPAKVSVVAMDAQATIAGKLALTASNDCGTGCGENSLIQGSAEWDFAATQRWTLPLLLSGTFPGGGNPAAEGVQSAASTTTGSYSASGTVGGEDEDSPPQSFTCNGTIGPNSGDGAGELFDRGGAGGTHLLALSASGTPTATGPDCAMPVTGDLMAAYYFGDTQTATGPFSTTVTVTPAELALPHIVKTIGSQTASAPPADCTWQGSSWFGADHCAISRFSWTGTLTLTPSCERVSTGTGYSDLSGEMRARLQALYTKLKASRGCWHCNIGSRGTDVQKDLYTRWHALADGQAANPDVCRDLKAAHFAQCPTGYNPDGTAQGGPAVPGSSRHEHGEAADITVTFAGQEDVGKYRTAAKAAGLCGPPATDPVHVELPYASGKQAARCHFG